MKLLQKAENQIAYFKVGIFGFQGSGKTWTAALLAAGLAEKLNEKTAAFFDTETGSDFVMPLFKEKGIQLLQAKTRSFTDLLTVISECEADGVKILIIDSITHIWRDLMDSYDKKLRRNGRLQFQDWKVIKGEWQNYTDLFVNSKVHIVVCGRAGFEYDYDFNQDGSKDLVKAGTKMKVESEFGFEPSLVIEMERVSESKKEIEDMARTKKQAYKPKIGSLWTHRAHVLKDRTNTINGQVIDNPTLEHFLPHLDVLNIGGKHLGVDTSRDSTDRFDNQGNTAWKREEKQKEIALEEIGEYLKQIFPSQTQGDKVSRMDLIELIFGKRSWSYVESKMGYPRLSKEAKRLDLFRALYPQYLPDTDFMELSNVERFKKIFSIVDERLKDNDPEDIPLTPAMSESDKRELFQGYAERLGKAVFKTILDKAKCDDIESIPMKALDKAIADCEAMLLEKKK